MAKLDCARKTCIRVCPSLVAVRDAVGPCTSNSASRAPSDHHTPVQAAQFLVTRRQAGGHRSSRVQPNNSDMSSKRWAMSAIEALWFIAVLRKRA